MSITLYTDFGAKYKLANTAPTDAEGADLAIFIRDYETEYLQSLLGYKMAQDFLTAIALVPTSGVWFDLWKGKEFTDRFGNLAKWPGFRNDVDLSPIVMFIYCKWQRARQSYSSGSGERVVLTENSERASVRPRIVGAWNDMVNMNLQLNDFLQQSIVSYPDYIGVHTANVKFFTTTNIFNV